MSVTYGQPDFATLPAALLPLAKQHLRVDFDDDDATITAYIKHAISRFERYSGWRIFGTPVAWLPAVPANAVSLVCPAQPIAEFAVTLADGTTDATSQYELLFYSPTSPLRLATKDRSVIPAGIAVDLTAGYADAAVLAPEVENLVLLITGTLYENRESVSAVSPDLLPLWMNDLLVGTWIPRA